MTREVLVQGSDDSRGGGPGRAVGVVVAVVLLAVAGVAVARSRSDGEPRARRTPAPSASPSQGWTEYPTDPPPPALPPRFRESVTVRRPPPNVLRAVLLPHDEPGFLVPAEEPGDEPAALSGLGGPPHAPVVVGWCAALETFQDQAGEHAYDRRGSSLGAGPGLSVYPVRRNARDPLRLDIGSVGSRSLDERVGGAPRACPGPVYLPALPKAAATVHDTIRAFRVVRGRYVASTERRAFCALTDDARCRGRGWESFGIGSLPVDELAGSYTWEGRFVVRGDRDGGLTAARLPGARLVRRERVGAEAVDLVVDDAEGAVREGRLRGLVGGRPVTYELRPDAEVFIGPGVTGLGEPRGTPETLRVYLMTRSSSTIDLAVVLDAQGRVLRVVVPPRGQPPPP